LDGRKRRRKIPRRGIAGGGKTEKGNDRRLKVTASSEKKRKGEIRDVADKEGGGQKLLNTLRNIDGTRKEARMERKGDQHRNHQGKEKKKVDLWRKGTLRQKKRLAEATRN